MTPGDRVRFSADGLLNGKRKQRHGTVTRVTHDRVWVLMDGNQNITSYWRAFIERLGW